MTICSRLADEAKVLKSLGEKNNVEYALCFRGGDVSFIRGEKSKVEVAGGCDVVLHNHLRTPYFSETDVKTSMKTIVCMVHKNILKCIRDGKAICSVELAEDIPDMTLTFDHHDARFNLLEIAKQLTLLEEHYAREEMRCADCIVKHLLEIQAYAEEGMRLEHGAEYSGLFEKARRIAGEHLKMLEGGVLREGALEELRELRKQIFEALHVYELEEAYAGLPVKLDKWDWEKVKPKLPSQRQEIMDKYGPRCFLRPQDLGFPICNVYGQVDCDGLRAAYVRAKALASASLKAGRHDLAGEYNMIADESLNIARSIGCMWVRRSV